jgi:mono/diheme cytochrome c family protein
VCTIATVGGAANLSAQTPAPATSLTNALPPDASGEQIFRLACATCHAADGSGAPQHVVGFPLPLPNGHDLPDFTDCATNTVEPMADWMAVVHRGGPVRGLDRHMPAFGDALTAEQIERVVRHLWSYCAEPAWPRGELNLPRAFFTEKAFPENETVLTTGVTTSGEKSITSELVYEHRIGARSQYEIVVPVDARQGGANGSWQRGLGDIELALRRTFYHDVDRGSIFAAGGAVVLPTGKEDRGLGNGFTVFKVNGETRISGFGR